MSKETAQQIPIFPDNRKTPETNVSEVNLTFEHKYLAVRYILR